MFNEKLRARALDIIFNLKYDSWHTCQNEDEFNKLRQTIPRLAKEMFITKTQGKNKYLLEFKFTRKDLSIKRKNMTYDEQMGRIKKVMEQEPWTEEQAKKWEELQEIKARVKNEYENMSKPTRQYKKKNMEHWEEKVKEKRGRRGPYRHR